MSQLLKELTDRHWSNVLIVSRWVCPQASNALFFWLLLNSSTPWILWLLNSAYFTDFLGYFLSSCLYILVLHLLGWGFDLFRRLWLFFLCFLHLWLLAFLVGFLNHFFLDFSINLLFIPCVQRSYRLPIFGKKGLFRSGGDIKPSYFRTLFVQFIDYPPTKDAELSVE